MNYDDTDRIRKTYLEGSYADCVYCVISMLFKMSSNPSFKKRLLATVGTTEMVGYATRQLFNNRKDRQKRQ